MTPPRIFIEDYAVVCALGATRRDVADNLFAAAPVSVRGRVRLNDGRVTPAGRIEVAGGEGETRTNRIVAQCYAPIAARMADVIARHGAARVGVVLGTSTSGIGEGGEAIAYKQQHGRLPEGFRMGPQRLGDTARFAARLSGAKGPCYVVSTACTSGARAMAAGARLIQAGLCDAVLCGGADALCGLTLNGFAALEALSATTANPMSANRDGLNIGEGAALFLLTRRESAAMLAGWGGSADGYHMSAPDPSGAGAEAAIRKALALAGAPRTDFVHLHGTATPLNDAMEAQVVARMFGLDTPCASTKPLTGHTLGAAGAVQAALCLLAMERGRLPPHIWDGARDTALPRIRLAEIGENAPLRTIVSASYAFGGNNAALILAAA